MVDYNTHDIVPNMWIMYTMLSGIPNEMNFPSSKEQTHPIF